MTRHLTNRLESAAKIAAVRAISQGWPERDGLTWGEPMQQIVTPRGFPDLAVVVQIEIDGRGYTPIRRTLARACAEVLAGDLARHLVVDGEATLGEWADDSIEIQYGTLDVRVAILESALVS